MSDAPSLAEPPPFDPVTGLIDGFAADGQGGAVPVSAGALTAEPGMKAPEGGYLWLHFQLEEGGAWAPANLPLRPSVHRALFAEETRPRLVTIGGGLQVNLRGVNLNEGRRPEDMLSLRLYLDEGLIVSVRKQRSVAVEEIRRRMAKGQAPKSTGALLLRIIGGLNDRIEPVVDELADRVDLYEERALRGEDAALRDLVSAMRHDAITFRRYIAPQRDAVSRFAAQDGPLLPKALRAQAREEAERVTRVVEELDATRERGTVIAEQLDAQRAEAMNRNMMIISVVSAVFLPLGFLTGLLGINVGGMPGADSETAFWIVCALCAALGGLLVTLFHRAGWL
jgi:zinc transporter